jgi:hypothetical protein
MPTFDELNQAYDRLRYDYEEKRLRKRVDEREDDDQ